MKIIRVDKYLRRIEALLCGDYERKLRRMEVMTMATQAALDALVARIDTAVAGIRADIEALKAREPELDVWPVWKVWTLSTRRPPRLRTSLLLSLSRLMRVSRRSRPPER
jgi:hypothetical protein